MFLCSFSHRIISWIVTGTTSLHQHFSFYFCIKVPFHSCMNAKSEIGFAFLYFFIHTRSVAKVKSESISVFRDKKIFPSLYVRFVAMNSFRNFFLFKNSFTFLRLIFYRVQSIKKFIMISKVPVFFEKSIPNSFNILC